MHLRYAIRNVENAIATQRPIFPETETMLKPWLWLCWCALGVLVKTLNTAMCVAALPIFSVLMSKRTGQQQQLQQQPEQLYQEREQQRESQQEQ